MTATHAQCFEASKASNRAARASMALEDRAVPSDYEPSELEQQILSRLFEERGWG
ncbi:MULTISPECIES: hypothetical protein [Corynebacterium]|uniref:hypothetical protein n=1 Tax=Corynebacterium TaxID=1716 RepID=UPI00143947EC|nr:MULTISPECIES: hypothetical protein [Corynebacterium]MDK8241533.1 hypothetical protein [Corynebacterium coyleae]MDK8822709.1 hypothetical protein [Corynebacterium coyleae]